MVDNQRDHLVRKQLIRESVLLLEGDSPGNTLHSLFHASHSSCVVPACAVSAMSGELEGLA